MRVEKQLEGPKFRLRVGVKEVFSVVSNVKTGCGLSVQKPLPPTLSISPGVGVF